MISFKPSHALVAKLVLDIHYTPLRVHRATLSKSMRKITMNHGFAYTICQTPIVYHQAPDSRLVVSHFGAEPEERQGLMLTLDETKSLFSRTGKICRIDVFFNFLQYP